MQIKKTPQNKCKWIRAEACPQKKTNAFSGQGGGTMQIKKKTRINVNDFGQGQALMQPN